MFVNQLKNTQGTEIHVVKHSDKTTPFMMPKTYNKPRSAITWRNMNKEEESIKESIIEYEALWDSMLKCQCGVRWKPSVKEFVINAPEEVFKMCDKLERGKWRNGTPKPIKITYPKKRDGLSISFTDRVYQRSINDNVLYPEMTKHFIFDNCACQTGKGPDFARRRLKEKLWNFYCHHGTNGYVLQIDIKEYFKHISHSLVMDKFNKYVPKHICDMISDVLDKQHICGEDGYNPGSQMVQIAGLSVLNDVDHFVKEKLHIKCYIRYNDDFLIIHESKEYLKNCLEQIRRKLESYGFTLHDKKTAIRKLSNGFTFLGFNYRVTETGKIIMLLNSDNIKHQRKKLRRMVNKCKRGEMSKEKVDESFNGWKEFASKGNSYKLIQRMDKYYALLWRS